MKIKNLKNTSIKDWNMSIDKNAILYQNGF